MNEFSAAAPDHVSLPTRVHCFVFTSPYFLVNFPFYGIHFIFLIIKAGCQSLTMGCAMNTDDDGHAEAIKKKKELRPQRPQSKIKN